MCHRPQAETLADAVEPLGGPEHAIGVAGRADDAEHQAAAVDAALRDVRRGWTCW